MDMTPAAFVEKWRKSTLKESAAYQEHFCDLCRMLGQPTPAEADPTGEFFTFQKGVKKNAAGQTVLEDTLFGARPVKEGTDGYADVWYRGHFAWEYKGKRKDLGEALAQLHEYLDDLENPPLLVVCDFDRYEIHTRFNNCVKQVYKFGNEDLTKPEILAPLRALFENPDALKPAKTVQKLTQEVAERFAALSSSLRSRGVEPHRAAHFLMKLLFCLFAEKVKLLPDDIFTRMVGKAVGGPGHEAVPDPEEYFQKHVRNLFRAMRNGGEVWRDRHHRPGASLRPQPAAARGY